MINEELNKSKDWEDAKCFKCGRSYPETILNIEGCIHHAGRIKCLNTKNYLLSSEWYLLPEENI